MRHRREWFLLSSRKSVSHIRSCYKEMTTAMRLWPVSAHEQLEASSTEQPARKQENRGKWSRKKMKHEMRMGGCGGLARKAHRVNKSSRSQKRRKGKRRKKKKGHTWVRPTWCIRVFWDHITEWTDTEEREMDVRGCTKGKGGKQRRRGRVEGGRRHHHDHPVCQVCRVRVR